MNNPSQPTSPDPVVPLQEAAVNPSDTAQATSPSSMMPLHEVSTETQDKEKDASASPADVVTETIEMLEAYEKECNKLVDEKTTLQALLDGANGHVELLKGLVEKEEIDQYNKAYEAERVSGATRKIQKQWDTALSLKDRRIEELEKKLKQTEERRAYAHQGYREAKSNVQSLTARNSNLTARVESLDNQNQKLTEELEQLKEMLESQSSEHHTQVITLKDEAKELADKLSDVRQAATEMEKAVEDTLEAERAARDDAAEFGKKIKDLQQENKELKEEKVAYTNASVATQTDTLYKSVATQADTTYTSVAIQTEEEPIKAFEQPKVVYIDREIETKRPKGHHGFTHWFLIAGTILMILLAAFALYHGLQARAERAMWLGANDYSRRAAIYYRTAAARGERVPWMTAAGIQQMKTGFGGGIRRGGVEW